MKRSTGLVAAANRGTCSKYEEAGHVARNCPDSKEQLNGK